MLINKPFAILALLLLFCFSSLSTANGFLDQFIDPEDGKFDTSNWLLQKRGFLPVPIIITEPAVGYGIGAAIIFFHEADETDTEQSATEEQSAQKPELPPSISGFAGAVTENDTWFGAVFHSGSYKNDRIRYLAGYIHPSVNLKFYGGGDSPVLSDGITYNLKGDVLLQELMFRWPETNLFLGGRLSYFDSQSTFKFNTGIPGIDNWELDTRNLGAGVAAKYDSRDNIFTPNAGWHVDARIMWHDGNGLQDFSYQYYGLHPRYYWQFNEEWILGLRAEAEFTSGEVPFYALPFINLRGIPAMRYQGDDALTTEMEVRWNLDQRWALIGFAGVGTVSPLNGDLGDGSNHWARGLGFRYQMAKKLGLYTGIDIARGPEDTVFYLQVGSAWAM